MSPVLAARVEFEVFSRITAPLGIFRLVITPRYERQRAEIRHVRTESANNDAANSYCRLQLRLSRADIYEAHLSRRAITGSSLNFVNTDCEVLALRLINRYSPEYLRDRAHPFSSCSRGTRRARVALLRMRFVNDRINFSTPFAIHAKSRPEREREVHDRARTRGIDDRVVRY